MVFVFFLLFTTYIPIILISPYLLSATYKLQGLYLKTNEMILIQKDTA